MRAVVTGGAGFIGSNLTAALRRRGWEVSVFDNFSTGFRGNLVGIQGVRVVEGDIRDSRDLKDAFSGAQVVFHLAASVGNAKSLVDPVLDAEVNVLGTIKVLEAALVTGVKKMVVSSSAGVFGELKTLPIAEEHPLEPDSPYGCSKLCAEKLSLAFGRLYGLGMVALRYFNVYGPLQRFDEYGNVIPKFVFRALQGEDIVVYGDGEQTRDFANVKDVLQANILAAEAEGVSGVFNIGSGTRVTINYLVELLKTAGLSGMKARHGAPRPGDVRHSIADISAAKQRLGYRPSVALADGVREYVTWAKEEVRRGQS